MVVAGLLTDSLLLWEHTAVILPTLQVMLETYGFQGVNIQVQAVLSLYAHGLRTGVVLDAGDGVSHAVSVVGGGRGRLHGLCAYCCHSCRLLCDVMCHHPQDFARHVLYVQVEGYAYGHLTQRLNIAGRWV